MNERLPEDHISRKRVVYRIPGMDAVPVRRDIQFSPGDPGTRTMDIYYPPDRKNNERLPVVVIVAGYPDPGYQRIIGCSFKEMGSSVSWAQLLAASGIIAITYSNITPAKDLPALLEYLRQNEDALEVNMDRVALLASSGNVPLALSLLMEKSTVLRCAALCYGFMLDLDGTSTVADMAGKFGFVNPCAGKSMDDLTSNVPLLVVRAGQDQMAGLNDTIDRFIQHGLARNLPIWSLNYPSAPHAFDLFDSSETSCEIVRQILTFFQFRLLEKEHNTASIESEAL